MPIWTAWVAEPQHPDRFLMNPPNYRVRFDPAYQLMYDTVRPFQRDEHWKQFFDIIADQVVAGIQPRTVLDAGCTLGLLVEALRQRGVDAWGFDPAAEAVEQADPSAQPYCWAGHFTDPLPQRYDLIICLEAVAHLTEAEAGAAIANLCRFSDDILFAATPPQLLPKNHIGKDGRDWGALFANQGFARDLEFDNDFFAPWAARFRKSEAAASSTIQAYERRLARLAGENAALRQTRSEANRLAQARSKEIESLNLTVKNLTVKEQELAQILGSRSWQFIRGLQNFRLKLIPLESRRERWMNLTIRAVQVLLHEGLRPLLRLAYYKFRTMEDYQGWLAWNEPSPAELERQRKASAKLPYRPLISFLTPVYNPPPAVLQETLDSVIAQTYAQWELCLVDGASEDPKIGEILRGYAGRDERVRVRFLEQNLGISGNTNMALQEARGEFVALLDHDDVIAPHALFEVVNLLNQKPETDLVYYDEDKLSPDGTQRRDPLFKPEWSPEMLLSANYLTHPVVRRSRVEEAGGFDPATDGAQDWDLMLRLVERTQNIERIPKVLYHWRQISGSTAAARTAKSWVFERQLASVRKHLERSGTAGVEASFAQPGFLRVTWPPSGQRVSIIIPTKDKVEYLQRCLHSILHLTDYPDYEVVLIDTGSHRPDTLQYYQTLKDEARVHLHHYSGAFNYSAANNLGTQYASGDLFLFLNNDTEILEKDWLEELARWVERPDVGIVGTKLLYPDNTIQHAGVIVGLQGHASHIFWGAQERQGTIFGSVDWYRNYMAVTGACMMTRRDLFEEIGGFNEDYILTFSDIEFCMRAYQQGFRVVYTPYARMRHHEGRSRGDFIPANDILVGYEQFHETVQAGDPYYNPNLSYASRMPALKPKAEENRIARLDRIVALRTQETGPKNH